MSRGFLLAAISAALLAGCSTMPGARSLMSRTEGLPKQGADGSDGSIKTTAPTPFRQASHEKPAPLATLEPPPETAQSSFEGAHSVDFYVRLALARNPSVLALERRVAAQSERIPQVTALPDPMLTDTLWPLSSNAPQTASGRMINTLTLTQRFPWLDKLRLRGEVADIEAQIALTELAEAQLKLMEAVRIAFHELAFQEEAISINVKQENLLRDYLKLAEVRYSVGATSQQDVLRTQVEISKLQDQLVVLRRDRRQAQADLARLISVSPESDLGATVDEQPLAVPEEIQALYQGALAARPELQGRLQAILRDQKKEDLAHLEGIPDLTLGVTWSAITTNDALSRVANGADNIGLVIGVNLPVWRQKIDAGVREARNRTTESSLQFNATRDETLRDVKRFIVQANALEQQLQLLRKEIIPRTEQTLKVSAADYQTGKVVLLQLLDNWSQLLRYQMQEARLRAALAQSLASLERAVGMEIPPVGRDGGR